MKHYVAGFMKDSLGNIALVRKNKPKWQAGRLNGIGGGIEDGEATHTAMAREWFEETGTEYESWSLFAQIIFDDVSIYFFKAMVDRLPTLPTHNDIGEAIEVHNYATAVRFTDMIPNLKWLMPLAFEDPDGLAVFALHAANDNGPLKVAA